MNRIIHEILTNKITQNIKLILMDTTKKYCPDCDKTLPKTEFHKNGISLMPTCKICRQDERSSQNFTRKEGVKYCAGCDSTHPTSDFGSDKSQPDGLQSYCKTARQLKRSKNFDTLGGFIKSNFKDLCASAKKQNMQINITIDDINKLYQTQNGLCSLTNIKMTHISTKNNNTNNAFNISINRINPLNGYTKNNINLICIMVSKFKTYLSDNDIILISGAITQYNFNAINQLIVSNIDHNNDNEFLINKSNLIIASLLDNICNKQIINNISLHQKFINSFSRYITKLYLGIKKTTKNIQLSITENDIKDLYTEQEGKCKLSGKQMTHIDYQGIDVNEITKWNISISKIDPTKYYTKDNIQLICNVVNTIKNNMVNDELLLLCDNIAKTNKIQINKFILEMVIV